VTFAPRARNSFAVGAVVPIAVVAVVRQEDDRRACPELVKRVEKWLREVRVGRAAAAVQEDEQWPSASSTTRKDEHLAQIAVDEGAREREALDVRTASRPVPAPEVANGDEADADCRGRDRRGRRGR
jgi:hypothetical protein